MNRKSAVPRRLRLRQNHAPVARAPAAVVERHDQITVAGEEDRVGPQSGSRPAPTMRHDDRREFLVVGRFGGKTSAAIRVPSLKIVAFRKAMSSGGWNSAGRCCARATVSEKVRRSTAKPTEHRLRGMMRFSNRAKRGRPFGE